MWYLSCASHSILCISRHVTLSCASHGISLYLVHLTACHSILCISRYLPLSCASHGISLYLVHLTASDSILCISLHLILFCASHCILCISLHLLQMLFDSNLSIKAKTCMNSTVWQACLSQAWVLSYLLPLYIAQLFIPYILQAFL